MLIGAPHVTAGLCLGIRQHTSAYVSIRQHTSVSIRVLIGRTTCRCRSLHTSAYVSMRQHASACVSQHTRIDRAHRMSLLELPVSASACARLLKILHTSAYVSIRQHTSAYVSIRQHTSAYVSIRVSASAYVSMRKTIYDTAHVSMRQHASAHTSAYVSIRQHAQDASRNCQRRPRQYLYLCTSKASKLST